MIDALESSNGKAKASPSWGTVSDDGLREENAESKACASISCDGIDYPRDVLGASPRALPARLGIVVYFEMADLVELEPFFVSLPTTVVVDHMGTPV
jgi:2-pyrone-4,6-dicarboxylate lactonase